MPNSYLDYPTAHKYRYLSRYIYGSLIEDATNGELPDPADIASTDLLKEATQAIFGTDDLEIYTDKSY